MSQTALSLEIHLDDLSGPEIRSLLEEHLAHMRSISPPDSVHALNIDALRRPGIWFWTAWHADSLAGCGALKEINPQHGEIKSMRTAAQFRGRGVARMMLAHLIEAARERGYTQLSVETGSQPEFEPACRLYGRSGFEFCPPFEGYVEDPHSVFMTRRL